MDHHRCCGVPLAVGFLWTLFLCLLSAPGRAAPPGAAAQPLAVDPPVHTIEVFTTRDRPVTGRQGRDAASADATPTVEVYRVDAIRALEARLSRDLPVDAGASERIVLERLKQLDATARDQLHHAASGLAKATQYGIDRIPAVVIDGQWVVYGRTDVAGALAQLDRWQRGVRR